MIKIKALPHHPVAATGNFINKQKPGVIIHSALTIQSKSQKNVVDQNKKKRKNTSKKDNCIHRRKKKESVLTCIVMGVTK